MFGRARILITIAACAWAMPAAAQTTAPTTTAFDGTYIGVSRTFEEATAPSTEGRTWTRFCLPSGPPAPLTIVNGIAQAGKLEGSVSPQGVLVMRSFWGHFDGRIDSQGTVRGRSTSACSSLLVWQKVPAPTMPFDGDYVGVSRESSCLANGVPVTLIIRNSVVTGGSWQGNVSPQGALVMRNSKTQVQIEGQVDGQGIIRELGSDGAGCAITFVWRKESP